MLALAELGSQGLFKDGDWVESKDQDPSGSVRLTQLADVGVGTFRNRSNRWMREDQARRLNCTRLEPHDVLIARMPDPIGRACIVPANIGDAVTAVDVAILRLDPTVAIPEYVMWMINAPQFNAAVVALQSGTTRKRISRKALAALSIPLPAMHEQRKIVEILEDHLSRLDAADHTLSTSLTRLDKLVPSVLAQRLNSMQERSVPSRAIGDLADTALGKMLDAKKLSGAPTRYLANINVRWGTFDLDHLKEVPLTDVERKKFELRPGDILACEGGEPGRCAVWQLEESDIAYQKALHRIRVRNKIAVEPRFLALMLQEGIQSHRWNSMFTGTTIKHLPQEKLRRITVPIPPISTQLSVVGEVADIQQHVGRLARATAQSRARGIALRQAVLAAAFKGKLTGRPIDQEIIEELAANPAGPLEAMATA